MLDAINVEGYGEPGGSTILLRERADVAFCGGLPALK